MNLTRFEKGNASLVIAAIWGYELVSTDNINNAVVDVLAEALTMMENSSGQIKQLIANLNIMHGYQKTEMIKKGGDYMASFIVNNLSSREVSMACINAASVYRNRLIMASYGM